jgi:hypothetical protein
MGYCLRRMEEHTMSPRSDIDTAAAPTTLTSLRVATGDLRTFDFRSTAFCRHPSRFQVRRPSPLWTPLPS